MQAPILNNSYVSGYGNNIIKTFGKVLMLIIVTLSLCSNFVFAADRLTVVVDKANIRSGPGKSHDVIWMVEKYHPVQVLKKSGSWYRFRDFEGDEGWIHSSLLRKIPAVIINKENCNVRSGPGTKYDVLFTVGKGIPFKVIKRQGKWIHVQHSDGDQGWLHQSLVW